MMNSAGRARVSAKLVRLLIRTGKCSCGHQKDYHINGKDKCMFGICHCQRFTKID